MTHEGMPTEFNFEWQKVPLDYEKWLQQKSETNLLSEWLIKMIDFNV